jgi:4-hydroxy-tetrahydrodipicolinate synthase
MSQPILSGTGVAIVTPFRNRAIDFPALEKIINHVVEGGVDFIVSLGTTGEAITQSVDECRQILDFTIEKVQDRVPIVAGLFGGNYTDKIVEALKRYNFDGITAVMSSSPAYSKPSQQGIYQHYMALAEASPLPIIIYNVPGRTSSNIEAATTVRLAHASDKFIAVKEASGDLAQAMSILKEKPGRFQVWSGEDPITLPMIACGATGAISVIANAFPKPFSSMVRHAMDGELIEAREHNDLLHDIHPHLYADGNPAGIKGVLEMLGLCSKEVRIPLTSLPDDSYGRLRAELRKAGLL